MKKIILTSSLYYPNTGGVENSLFFLAEAAKKKGDDICIIVSNIVQGGGRAKEGTDIFNGTNIERYNVPVKGHKIVRALKYIKSAYYIYKNRYRSGTIVIARYHWNVVLCYAAGYREIHYLVPGVVKFQNNKTNASKSVLSYKIECLIQKLAFKLAKKIFVFSSNMVEQINAVEKKVYPIKVLPGVDVNKFYPVSKKDCSIVNLIIVCRLVKAKGVIFAIEAMKYLDGKYILNIIGDGDELESLNKLAKDLELEDRVFFLGRQNDPVTFYNKADIFLLPSLYEPFGQTLLEASACGLVTVAFGKNIVNTATYDVLGDLAYYADELSSYSYADAIKRANAGQSDNSSRTLRALVEKNYNWDVLYDEITKD